MKGRIMNCRNSFNWQTENLIDYESSDNHVTCKDKRMGIISVYCFNSEYKNIKANSI